LQLRNSLLKGAACFLRLPITTIAAMTKKIKYLFPFVLITSLFFLWGLAHNFNPILIPHLKKACQLTDTQSAFIDSAFFIGYFLMALPAGMIMKRAGYKSGIILGLILFAVGAFLFYPAAEYRTFPLFLLALFIIASGLTFLETAANPYITVLSAEGSETQMLNFAQSFNGLAATIAPLVGGLFILSGNVISNEQMAAYTPAQLDAILAEEARSVQMPYLVIGCVVLLVALLLWRTRLPDIKQEAETAVAGDGNSIWQQHKLLFGVLAQFFYVGAQVCVSSFFIRFAFFTAAVPEKSAAYLLSLALFAFMAGRFIGTFLMKYMSPRVLLAIYSLCNIVLLLLAVNTRGMVPVYALIGVEFFMSIMFPTIFSLSIEGLGRHTKLGSSLLVMAIAGGAVFPVIMGRVSDRYDIQIAYLVPAACFIVVALFALRVKPKTAFAGLAAAH
jgi:FHS family L-fucose permease-like MFS transporter